MYVCMYVCICMYMYVYIHICIYVHMCLSAAARINAWGLHVLVDLDVWMKGRRPEILALRPAPLQLVYLGYPGAVSDVSLR